MSKVIIGCDPDSKMSGFSFFIDGELKRLECMNLVQFYNYLLDDNLPTITFKNVELHIENLNGISSNAFSINRKDPLPVKLKKAEHVGKCKQVQIEIERIAERFDIKVVRHGVSKMWKDSKTGKAALADLGWHGQSNEDSRSATYFGYLGVKQSNKNKP
jgi:hypothetical protein